MRKITTFTKIALRALRRDVLLPDTLGDPSQKALIDFLKKRVPNDPHGRIFAEILAGAAVLKACEPHPATRQNRSRLPGRIPRSRVVVVPSRRYEPISVVWADGEPPRKLRLANAGPTRDLNEQI